MAQVTAGGVSTKEIIQGTLESKLLEGLYVVGEVTRCRWNMRRVQPSVGIYIRIHRCKPDRKTMIRINQIKLPIDHKEAALEKKIKKRIT